jgi:hypothetical protein
MSGYRTILGIDVGAEGAVATLEYGVVGPVELLKNVDHNWFRANFADRPPGSIIALIEKAQAMPKNGAVGMFNYGYGAGRIQGWLEALGIPHVLVPPREWTKVMHRGCYGDTPKAKSLMACKQLFPTLDLRATPKSKKSHEGIVDALVLAAYGYQHRFPRVEKPVIYGELKCL